MVYSFTMTYRSSSICAHIHNNNHGLAVSNIDAFTAILLSMISITHRSFVEPNVNLCMKKSLSDEELVKHKEAIRCFDDIVNTSLSDSNSFLWKVIYCLTSGITVNFTAYYDSERKKAKDNYYSLPHHTQSCIISTYAIEQIIVRQVSPLQMPATLRNYCLVMVRKKRIRMLRAEILLCRITMVQDVLERVQKKQLHMIPCNYCNSFSFQKVPTLL
jgi:hypothetical protein